MCTSAGNDGFPAVYRAICANSEARPIAVLAVDCRECAPGLHLAHEGAVVPLRNDPSHMSAVLELIHRHSIDVLLPLSTEDQAFYSGRENELGIPIVTSDAKALRVANDKYLLVTHLEQSELASLVPRFIKPDGRESLERGASELGYPENRVVYKFDRGTGAQGLKILDASVKPEGRISDRLNRDIRLAELAEWLSQAQTMPEAHLVEYLPGTEYSVDVLCNGGTSIQTVVRRRDGSMFGLATDTTVVDEPDIQKAAEDIVALLGLSFVINVQFRRDASGAPKILEINPRIPGSIDLTVASGVNMPYLALKLALGEAIEPSAPKVGTRLLRVWSGVVLEPGTKD